MINIKIDISQLKNDITQIHSELHETQNMNDNQRRDAVNRIVEKVRTLKSRLNDSAVDIEVK